ncbi:MAG TPA: hypothetical protein VF355_07455 [Anaerolineaceae bacterium]
MKLVTSILKKFSQPLVIFMVCILAFGLQVFFMGYYIDDWVILNAYSTKGFEGLRLYAYLDNRPLVFWIWWVGFQVNGFTPALWQIWSLLWRIASVVTLWMALREIWPQHKRQVLVASLLFAVYPIFLQQPTALTYSFHWVCFTLFFLSLYFTVLSVKVPGKYGRFTLLSILMTGIQLFSQEFFVGLELIRPFIIWYLQRGVGQTMKNRLRKVVMAWLPYLVMMGVYGAWRFVIMPAMSGADRNAPKLLSGLVTSPLATIVQLAQFAMQDIINGLLGSWYKTIQPDQFVLTPISGLITLGLIGITFVLLLFGLPRVLMDANTPESADEYPWYRSAIPLGFIAMVLGFAPGWAIGRQYSDVSGMFNDRFGLAAMVGTALVVTALVDWIIQNKKHQLVIYSLLIALAVGNQFRTESNYRWSWEQQTRFAWELNWRAPQLEAPTAVIAEGTLFKYMGGFPNKAYINQIYAFNQNTQTTPFWYFDMYKTDTTPFVTGEVPIAESRGTMSFSGGQADNLVVQYTSDQNQCLWVLNSDDHENPYLTQQLKYVLPLSNLDRIKEGNQSIPSSLFGPEPAPFWCYYYEKGALAVQFKQWDEAVRLWNEAQQKGFKPGVGTEYIPFIQAAVQTGDWQMAEDLSKKADYPATQMNDDICGVWQKILQGTPPSGQRDSALKFVQGQFVCSSGVK